jgi:two-component system, NtrC family, sensor histidine kinase HydH
LMMVALLGGTLSERLRTTGGQLVRAEARANQAEREALLGRLAAGLAHEIRNPLGSIAGSIRLLETNPHLSHDDLVLCGIIDREAQRLNELVSDMLNLANPRRPERGALDLAALAREVVELARHSGRGTDDVELKVQADTPVTVLADGAMIRQLLWNLVRNAVQASAPGGVVSVDVEVGRDHAEVAVVDHGVGIDLEARAHLFDPFFTTRSQGTGIGLAVVKRIVDEHGWRIAVEDTPGGGASFVVRLDTAPGAALGSKPPVDERWTLFPKHLPGK